MIRVNFQFLIDQGKPKDSSKGHCVDPRQDCADQRVHIPFACHERKHESHILAHSLPVGIQHI